MPTNRKTLASYLSLLRAMGGPVGWSSLRHRARFAYWQRAYAPQDRRPGEPEYLGYLRECRPLPALRQGGPAGAELRCMGGVLRVEFPAEGIARVRLSRSGFFPTLYSYAVVGLEPDRGGEAPVPSESPVDSGAVDPLPSTLTIAGDGIRAEVSTRPCRLAFYDAEGQSLCADGDGAGWQGATVVCAQQLADGQSLYGLGEKAFGLNRRGLRLTMRTTDPPGGGYGPGEDPLYQNTPFLVSLLDGTASGVFFDNTYCAQFDLGLAQRDRMLYSAAGGELCYYVLAGPDMGGLLRRFTALTGRMAMPPRWALGYHQSRWSYASAEEVRQIAADLRSHRIPCDALHLDIDYMDGYRVFTWNLEKFPDPAGLIADLAARGFRTVPIIDPGVKTDPAYPVCAEGLMRNAFVTLPDGRPFVGPVWPGECYFPDFTNAGVRAWWGDHYRSLIDLGVGGLWNDMNEPAVFMGSTFPDAVQHRADNGPADHRALHSVYGQCMLRSAAEAVQRLAPDRRMLLITRACYAGVQRYGMTWTGDNHSTWESLRVSIPLVLNMGLSGQAFTGPDVAGFGGHATGELLARWTEMGALLPFFRNHSALGTDPQEPYRFGEPYESICRRYIELRYRLLPYLYTAFWQAAESGLPIVRPPALVFPTDRRLASLDDEFLCGDALLVAPVLAQGAEGRGVYLPAGDWYDFWTGQRYEGGQDIAAHAPLDSMPLYARAGQVVTMGPVVQHTGERTPETLELHVFSGTGESLLYEDDGATYAYQRGERRLTRFTLNGDGAALTLSRQAEGPYDPGTTSYDVLLRGLAPAEGQTLRIFVDGAPAEWTLDEEWHAPRIKAGMFERVEVGNGAGE